MGVLHLASQQSSPVLHLAAAQAGNLATTSVHGKYSTLKICPRTIKDHICPLLSNLTLCNGRKSGRTDWQEPRFSIEGVLVRHPRSVFRSLLSESLARISAERVVWSIITSSSSSRPVYVDTNGQRRAPRSSRTMGTHQTQSTGRQIPL